MINPFARRWKWPKLSLAGIQADIIRNGGVDIQRLTAFGFTAAYPHVMDMWRQEKADAVVGRLTPRRDGQKHSDVTFQVGPNAKAHFQWTAVKDKMDWGNLGSYIRLKRNDAGDLVANTIIRDHAGNLLVEIVDNEWRVVNESCGEGKERPPEIGQC